MWHWRDDGPHRLHCTFINAPTVDHATAALRRQLGPDYNNVATELAVIFAEATMGVPFAVNRFPVPLSDSIAFTARSKATSEDEQAVSMAMQGP